MRGITFTILAGCASLAVAGPGGQSETNDYENYKVQKYIIWSWIALVGVVFIYRFSLAVSKKFRMVVTMGDVQNDGRQRYFSTPNSTYAFLKRHIILAPLFSKRHNREFKLSTAISVCTLPGRLHVLFLLALFASNAAYCAITIDWTNKSTFFSDGVHRTGVVLVTNIVALFLLAGRNNPLIYLLGIGFDTYNLIHRWIGRLVVLETLAHAGFWVAGQVVKLGGDGALTLMKTLIATKPLFISGCIGTAAFVVLLLHSPGAIRHAFYETFLHIHILAAVVGTGAVWVHLNGFATQSVLLLAIIFWGLERFARFWWLMRRNIKGGLTKADFEVLPGEAIRVTMHVARPWNFQPGQHIYLNVPSIGLWTSHPFSVVWSQEQDGYSREKRLPTSRTDTLRKTKTSMSLIIRRRTGFTDSLFKKAEAGVGGKISRTAFVEGPYGSQSFRSYGTVMLFAAGVGVTHQVPHVRDLVQSFADGTCATRKVTLVWVIQTPEHLEWIRPWMTQILGMDKRRDILKILLFVSRPRSTKEIHSPSSSVQMFPGKPDVAALVQKEQDHQIGAMAVSVCGTGGMADDVRKAVRDRQQRTEIDFYEEAFSW